MRHHLIAAFILCGTSLALLNIPEEFRVHGSPSFDQTTCQDAVERWMKSNASSSIPLDSAFSTGEDGSLLAGKDNMTIKVEFCEQICGPLTVSDWYTDRGPRIMTWIIPIILLLSNIELSPLDKRRFFTLFQALGDPFGMLFSLVEKLKTRTMIYDLTSQHLHALSKDLENVQLLIRGISTVLASFEDLLGPELESVEHLITIIDTFDPTNPPMYDLWMEAALELSDSRSDERLRSLFAITLYVLQLLSAFIFDIGGGSANPPGGTIALAISLSFLIPMVLLTACIGSFTSRRTALRIIRRFVRGAGRDVPEELNGLFERRAIVSPPGMDPSQWDEYFKSLHWIGGKDTYQPWKLTRYLKRLSQPASPVPPRLAKYLQDIDLNKLEKSGVQLKITSLRERMSRTSSSPLLPPSLSRWTTLQMPLFSTLPVFVGLAAALSILQLAGEAGWSCRHLLILCILFAFILSSLSSSLSYLYLCHQSTKSSSLSTPSTPIPTPTSYLKTHYLLSNLKDFLLSVSILTFISISAAGFFNSCGCWGRRLFAGHNAGVVLNVDAKYMMYNKKEFPGIVGGVVGFHLLWILAIGMKYWKGVKVLRWGEGIRSGVWRRKASWYGEGGRRVAEGGGVSLRATTV